MKLQHWKYRDYAVTKIGIHSGLQNQFQACKHHEKHKFSELYSDF